MDLTEKTALGRSGLRVGRLGISSSFGAPTAAFEEAFERGCNYFTWGSAARGRSAKMGAAINNITAKGKRDELVVATYAYSHVSLLMEGLLKRGLRKLKSDYLDVLILGYYSGRPSQRHIDLALKLKQEGIVRAIGLSGHNRKLFVELAAEDWCDIFHIRYNAAHRGAEEEIFPHIDNLSWPGIVGFTATRWRKLLKQKKMPPDETAPSAADCYRFVLSHPAVDVCLMGAKNREQMTENLQVLELGSLNEDEMARMKKIGDFVYGKKR